MYHIYIYEQYQPIHFLKYRIKHIKFKKNIATITQIWDRPKCYFTCISNTWYQIKLPNMNKINHVGIITEIWHRAICHFTSMSNTWYLIIVRNMYKIITFFFAISQLALKIYEQIAIITLAQSHILFYVHQRTMVPDQVPNMKKNPSSHHGGMHQDEHPDG